MTGSCTEAQVSHVLSKRFSRNPMGWSEEALGKLASVRVFMLNGGKLSADHFKPGEAHKKYNEYADKLIAENIGGAVDWSLFDVERTTFDLASGTQIKIHGLSRINNTLFS